MDKYLVLVVVEYPKLYNLHVNIYSDIKKECG